MNRLKKKLFVPALLACMLLIAACSDNSAMSLKEDEKAVVKIMYWNEQMFFQEYGNLFNVKFPNVEIEVVSSQPLYGFNLEKCSS